MLFKNLGHSFFPILTPWPKKKRYFRHCEGFERNLLRIHARDGRTP